ncbi:transposase [candidate division FCPU426 bacterium]|nr:transposase [candidate division FCPU426 bacterium]
MGRPLRIKASDITYHITSRTNGKRLYMKKSRDRRALCRCLQKVQHKYKFIIYGFTPMGNHFHLLLKIADTADLSQIMCEFKTAYAKYYNSKYNTSGHFWGDRFRSTLVDDDKHLLACLRYIDRNPLTAGLIKTPQFWRYGTYACYAFGARHEFLKIKLHPTFLEMASTGGQRRLLYRDYVSRPDSLSDNLRRTLDKRLFWGSPAFISTWEKVAGI